MMMIVPSPALWMKRKTAVSFRWFQGTAYTVVYHSEPRMKNYEAEGSHCRQFEQRMNE